MKNLIVILIICLIPIVRCTDTGHKTGIVRANNILLAYESFGSDKNESIILIQGTGATLLHYPTEFCQKLASEGYRVIRFDNRDIGASSKLDSLGQPDWEAIIPLMKTCDSVPLPYTLLDMAKDVVGLMDALKIKKAHIAGASMGGAIAQIIAINFPDRLLSLTCFSASTGNPNLPEGNENALKAMSTPPPQSNNTDTIANYLINIYKALGAVDDDKILLERAKGHINRGWQPDAVNRQVAAVVIGENCDRRKDLKNLNIPALIIHGDSDPIVTLDSGKELAASIPDAQLCVINGLGHDLSLKFIDEIVTCMIDNMKR